MVINTLRIPKSIYYFKLRHKERIVQIIGGATTEGVGKIFIRRG